jgi:hypothetical protein
VLFLNIPSLQKAIGAEELLFYPALKEKYEKVKEMWDTKPAAVFPTDHVLSGMVFLC